MCVYLFFPPQAEKMSSAMATLEFAKCVKGCANNIANVRAREEALEAYALKALRLARANERLDEEFVEYKVYPEWGLWSAEQDRKLSRQRTLVVCGPSRLGKTEYLKAQLAKCCPERPETLIINCMNVRDPDLKRFKVLHHGSILFDEGSPDMVQRHRDLFQARQDDVVLGNSATGCYTYSVNLFRVRLVVTSNAWDDELTELKPADRDWVNANTVVLRVKEPMWVTAGASREQNAPASSSQSTSSLASRLSAAGA